MMAKRPDQDRFDQFVAPLHALDGVWESFGREWGGVLECNPHRKPGRILRKRIQAEATTTLYMVELYLDPFWYDTAFSVDLFCTFAVGAHVEKSVESGVFWAISTTLAKDQSIEWMGQRLSPLLEQAGDLLVTLTPEHVMALGEKRCRPVW